MSRESLSQDQHRPLGPCYLIFDFAAAWANALEQSDRLLIKTIQLSVRLSLSLPSSRTVPVTDSFQP